MSSSFRPVTSRAMQRALDDDRLQAVLARFGDGFEKTGWSRSRACRSSALRGEGKAIKDHVLDNLDVYLEMFEQNVIEAGGQVHWVRLKEAQKTVLQIAKSAQRP